MKDLTQGPIWGHLLSMAAFIFAGLIFQTLYYLVDLYFVSHLGEAAIAGVSSASTLFMLTMATSQLVGVGPMALISQAIGAKQTDGAETVHNQALSMALFMSVCLIALGLLFGPRALSAIGADEATARAAKEYFLAFLPALALMYPTVALGAALRASGVVRPTMFIQTGSILLNVVLAPVLIAGWGTGVALGVAGAGLASSIASAAGFIALLVVFPRVQSLLRSKAREMAPKLSTWARIAGIGLPTMFEFLIMFVIISVMYYCIRHFGAHAQAGFGIGGRIMQSIFLPAMAIAFAAAPIVGQNFGAKKFERVRETFRWAALIGAGVMLTLTLLCIWRPEVLILPFTTDAEVGAVAATYLRIMAWNFVPTGLVFACSSTVQGLGDTRPSLFASASRILTSAAPAVWMSTQTWVRLEDFWHLSVASVLVQACVALFMLNRTLKRKLALQP